NGSAEEAMVKKVGKFVVKHDMKRAKWRDLSDDEMKQKVRELSEEITNLQSRLAMGIGKTRTRVTTRSHRIFTRFVAKETPTATKVEMIRSGVTARVVEDMVKYFAVSKSDIFTVLRTPESTAHKLIRENRPLDAGASERVVRVAEITRAAEETFGGRELATQW